MLSNKFSAFLWAFLAISWGQTSANYLIYKIGSELCSQDIDLNNGGLYNTSIILESNETMTKLCPIRIKFSPKVDGVLVNGYNLSIVNILNGSCDNGIEFGSSPITQWCKTSDAKTLIIDGSTLDIAFKSDLNNSLDFHIILTPFEKPISGQNCMTSAPFSCQLESTPFQCISDVFHCDGLDNCLNGNDERNCSVESQPNVDQMSDPLTQIFSNDLGYKVYNMTDKCDEIIDLNPKQTNGSSAAILQLFKENLKHFNGSNCMLRFSSSQNLVLGIDYISIESKNCEDFIQISNPKEVTTWCANNKTDVKGLSLKTNEVDILFHTGSHNKSSFRFVITQYEKPLFTEWCPNGSTLKCYSSGKECVSKQFQCDGHRNCPDGEDESKCHITPPPPPTTTTTTTTTKPTPITTTTTPTTTTTSKTTTKPITTTSAPPKPTTTLSPNSTTTGAPHTSPSPSPPSDDHHMSAGMIALTVIGTLVGVLLISVLIYYCVKRRAPGQGYNALN